MKLSFITELFDKINMTGITIHPPKKAKTGNLQTIYYKYTFQDPNLPQSPNYIVSISEYTIPPPPYNQGDMIDINRVISPKAAAAIEIMDQPHEVQSLGIDLETEEYSIDLTNLGNSIYVYSKLVAILINHIQKTRIPEFIRYFGAEANMDIAYYKLNSLISKKYPQLTYDKISFNVHINRSYYEQNKKYFQALKDTNEKETIEQYKKYKNKERSKTAPKPRTPNL